MVNTTSTSRKYIRLLYMPFLKFPIEGRSGGCLLQPTIKYRSAGPLQVKLDLKPLFKAGDTRDMFAKLESQSSNDKRLRRRLRVCAFLDLRPYSAHGNGLDSFTNRTSSRQAMVLSRPDSQWWLGRRRDMVKYEPSGLDNQSLDLRLCGFRPLGQAPGCALPGGLASPIRLQDAPGGLSRPVAPGIRSPGPQTSLAPGHGAVVPAGGAHAQALRGHAANVLPGTACRNRSSFGNSLPAPSPRPSW